MGQKRKSDGGGLGPHVEALRGGRTRFSPDVQTLVGRFLLMLNRRYTEAAHAASGRHDGVNYAIKAGIVKRYHQLASAAEVFLADLCCPWSRAAWHRSDADLDAWVASVLAQLPKDDAAGGGAPPAGDKGE